MKLNSFPISHSCLNWFCWEQLPWPRFAGGGLGCDSRPATVRVLPRCPGPGQGSLLLAGLSWQPGLGCGEWSRRAGGAKPSGQSFMMTAACLPWIKALLSSAGMRKEAGSYTGAGLCNTTEQSQPKASSLSPMFHYPSPCLGARLVCCSKPGLTNTIFHFIFCRAAAFIWA